MDLSKHIKEDASYNVSIAEVGLMSGGFTDKQLEQLGKILAEALTPIYDRLDKIEANIKLIMSLPTIKKELMEIKQV